ncbi:shikimate kinase [Austwickia chelonae]|uniref:Shikimate kinase n=1 Tax=Austwickia chelonae NBRC 105200 TaxID=1184607 RepID=K6VLU3_9MICO|nr:shikimate kinase [Austwickia chelonae]GAB77704.1 shikimate kinase [Austwickia chelonae NBRC 105200]SEW16165.1 shikimate kinase [Austwickia chelonae]
MVSSEATGGPVVVLIGPPGAGKSTVAREIAVRTGHDVADTDLLVEEQVGMTIPDIFIERGEAFFREVEADVVVDAMSRHRGVLALGGGAILAQRTQQALSGHPVVFLDLSLREAVRRTGLDHGRPLLALNPRGAWLRLMEERREIYQRLSVLRIDTSDMSAAEAAGQVVTALGLEGDGGDE